MTKIPRKELFLLRELTALVIATVLAHADRWFDLWPRHPYLASGHMTFSLGIALSLGLLRPWTLAITLPILVPFGIALVVERMHAPVDVVAALPLVLIVYWIVHKLWPLAAASPPPLDMANESP